MLEGIITLASSTFFPGGNIGSLLSQWEQMGLFSYVLPFLLIFALIFGILMKINLFGDSTRSMSAIIALAVALMSLQFDFVPTFFAEVFPRMGIGLAAILAILVVGGLFIDPNNKGIMIGLMILSLIIVAVVLVKSAGAVGWYWLPDNWPEIVGVIIFIALLAAVIGAGATGDKKDNESVLSQLLKKAGN